MISNLSAAGATVVMSPAVELSATDIVICCWSRPGEEAMRRYALLRCNGNWEIESSVTGSESGAHGA